MRAQQDFFNGKRGVECPRCRKIVTVYGKAEARQVKANGCLACCSLPDVPSCACQWEFGDNTDCPIHGRNLHE